MVEGCNGRSVEGTRVEGSKDSKTGGGTNELGAEEVQDVPQVPSFRYGQRGEHSYVRGGQVGDEQ